MTGLTKNTVVVACVVFVLAFTAVQAVDIEKKWRIGLAVGGYDSRDQVQSDAANVLTVTDASGAYLLGYEDPRNDQAAIGQLSIRPTQRATLSAQYAVTKIFVVELSAGYQKGDVGDIEVQAQFDYETIPSNERFNFHVYRVPAGTLEQIPLKLSGMARFRPRARLNPYIGGGLGFTFVGFEPSADLNQLSSNMDNSVGVFAPVSAYPGSFSFNAEEATDLDGASVDARDTFEWHLLGGAELSFKKHWAAFLELRYSFASRSINLTFNGSDSLGVSVPTLQAFITDPIAGKSFGSYAVLEGGLIDGGRLVPLDPADPEEICEESPGQCEFVLSPDGVPDTGFYYVKGGDFRYDNVTLHIGLRYTF